MWSESWFGSVYMYVCKYFVIQCIYLSGCSVVALVCDSIYSERMPASCLMKEKRIYYNRKDRNLLTCKT